MSKNPQVKKTSKKNNGRWTKKEHHIFLKGLKEFGRDWKKMRELLPSRSLAQIRSHAQKYFIRMETEKYNSDDEMSDYDG